MRKALLIEDNENNRYLLALLLKHAGFQVVEAPCGADGIKLARHERPDIILLDIQMPEMDGHEVMAALQCEVELSQIPVVGVSSFAMPGDRERALTGGFAAYIEKPVDPETFAVKVAGLL